MLPYVKSPIHFRYFSHKMLLMSVWAFPQCTFLYISPVYTDLHLPSSWSPLCNRMFRVQLFVVSIPALPRQCSHQQVLPVDLWVFVFLNHYFVYQTDQYLIHLTELYQSCGFGKNQPSLSLGFLSLNKSCSHEWGPVYQSTYLKYLSRILVTVNMHYLKTTLCILNSFSYSWSFLCGFHRQRAQLSLAV